MRYVPDSARPPATVSPEGGRLTWDGQLGTGDGVTVTLRLAPLRPGLQPLAREAGATWADILGYPAQVVAPTAEVVVEAAP